MAASTKNKFFLSIAELAAQDATSVDNAARLIGISRCHAYAEIRAGRLRRTKIGNRSLITKNERLRYLAAMEAESNTRAAA